MLSIWLTSKVRTRSHLTQEEQVWMAIKISVSLSDAPTVPLRAIVPGEEPSPLVLSGEEKEREEKAPPDDDSGAVEWEPKNAHHPKSNFCITVQLGRLLSNEEVTAIKDTFNGRIVEIEARLRLDKVGYMTFQAEQGETGNTHLQMYMEIKGTAHKFTKITKLLQFMFKRNGHIGVRKGSAKEAKEYCEKEDTQIRDPILEAPLWNYSFGVWKEKEQGKRTDLDAMYAKVKAGATMQECMDDNPRTVQQAWRVLEAGVAKFRKDKAYKNATDINKKKEARDALIVEQYELGVISEAESLALMDERVEGAREWWVMHGTSGGGKSHAAVTRCGEYEYNEEAMEQMIHFQTDEGFANTGNPNARTVFADEMDKATGVNWRLMLALADSHVCEQKQKGTNTFTYSHDLLITAGNKHPREWLPQTPEILRRITRVYEFTMTYNQARLRKCSPYKMILVTPALRAKWLKEGGWKEGGKQTMARMRAEAPE